VISLPSSLLPAPFVQLSTIQTGRYVDLFLFPSVRARSPPLVFFGVKLWRHSLSWLSSCQFNFLKLLTIAINVTLNLVPLLPTLFCVASPMRRVFDLLASFFYLCITCSTPLLPIGVVVLVPNAAFFFWFSFLWYQVSTASSPFLSVFSLVITSFRISSGSNLFLLFKIGSHKRLLVDQHLSPACCAVGLSNALPR